MTTSSWAGERGSRRRRWCRHAIAVAVAAVLIQPGPTSAQEPEEAQFAVQPSGPNGPGERDWFVYTLNPGDTWGDTVAISNLSDRPMRFFIYSTDGLTIDGTGGFSALRDDVAPVDVGSWVHLAANEYLVEPGMRIDVPFSVTVPDDAEPGDHAGVILAVDADDGSIDPSTAGEGVSFDVRRRIGARIYVRVNGEFTPALRIDELDVQQNGDAATVTWQISNTGNLRLNPTAEVRVTGLFGRTVATLPAQQLAEMLPGSNLVGGTAVADLPGFEPLTAHLVVRAEGVEVERSRTFRPFPWAVFGGLLLALLALGWFLRSRYRRRHPRPAARPAEPPRKVPVSA
jgi:hypothetical protein